jgi:hypothetical protein
MSNPDPSHVWEVASLPLAFLAGAITLLAFFIVWRRAYRTIHAWASTEHFPFWARLSIELVIGAVLAVAVFRATHEDFEHFEGKEVVMGILHALFAFAVFEIGHTAYRLALVESKLKKLDSAITDDERIILARSEPFKDRPPVSIVTVELLDRGQLPQALPLAPQDRKWAITISVLRVDRVQDLLFSTDYLRHFLTLHTSTEKQYRILVINDRPRSEAAARSFLLMSEQMPEADRINTYVYLKSEFYRMLHCVEVRLSPKKASAVGLIMVGQPDLSLTRNESDQDLPIKMTNADDYLLRYREKSVKVFGSQLPNRINIDYVDCVQKLMHVAIRENGRLGLVNLDRVLCRSVPNPWECDDLKFLQKDSRPRLSHSRENIPGAN